MANRKLPVLTEPLSRRQVLGAGAAVGAALLVTACGPGPGPGGPDGGGTGGTGGDGGTDAGQPGDGGPPCQPTALCTPTKNALTLPLAQHPELVPVVDASSLATGMGWGVYQAPGFTDPSQCAANWVIVAQTAPGVYAALSASCTHQCCLVGISNDGSGLTCPCHGSYYDFQGQVIVPAISGQANLAQLPVCFDGCSVYVQIP